MITKIKKYKDSTVEPTDELLKKIDSWIPFSFRIGTWNHCFYCGIEPTDADHLVPLSMLTLEKRNSSHCNYGITAPSCRECNSLLSNLYFDSLMERCQFANQKLRKKYSKLLNTPNWEPSELKQVGNGLVGYIIEKQQLKNAVVDRILWQSKHEFREMFQESIERTIAYHPHNKNLLNFINPS